MYCQRELIIGESIKNLVGLLHKMSGAFVTSAINSRADVKIT